MGVKRDPENYRKMSEPYPSPEEANKELDAFMEGVEALRNQRRVADVHVIVRVNMIQAGAEGAAMASAHFGDTTNAEMMCAWSFGKETANRQAVIARMLKAAGEA
jgi:hypothetical protein